MARPAMRSGGLDWWLRAGVEPARVRDLLARCAAPEWGPESGARKRLERLDLAGGGTPDHLLKLYRPTPRRPRRRSRARRELEVAESLAARGLPVALPLAAGERRRGGRWLEGRLLVPLLPGFVDLRARLRTGGLEPGARRRLAGALGALARRAHDAGLQQDDFTATNLLIAAGDAAELRLVDFERARLRVRVGPGARARMLARLERALGADASSTERWRFLCAYSGGDREAARRWGNRVAAAAAALLRRDRRRLGRDARRAARRFRALSAAGWRGVARIDACPERLARAAAEPPEAARDGFGLAATAGDLWDLHYPRTSPRRGLQLFASAGALAEWGLAVRPLALLRRGPDHRILCERASSAPVEPEAAGALLRRLGQLGVLETPPGPELLVHESAPDGRGRARLIAPHLLRFARGRSVGSGSIR